MGQDPLAGVTVFVAAARAGSFTLAADRLGLTKSAVGKTIAKMEEQLGFKLFHRTTRISRLTADGEAYLATCAAALDEIVATRDALASGARKLSGRLRIDMPVVFGRKVLLPILFDIVRTHPGLSLGLNFTDAKSDLLQDDVDLAIRFGALKDSSTLIARRLATQERVICASPDYLSAYGAPASLAAVHEHRCILGSTKGPPLAWFVRENGAEKRFLPPVTHQFGDGQAMIDAALAGLGLCQLPIFMVREALARGALLRVLPEVSDVTVEIHAVWPRGKQLNPRVRHVVDRLVAHAALGRLG
ncbi:transcriptional regulator, LysR family [Rhodoblastus acidophilus]|uniref:Transcriptional regulator, LysR family n=1 Tax=Rhodoblastus acidophilus TaxID=1074 RepID=A0A212S9Q2_RHOAC|nr:LysR family transcriptional regulator [Rhodoblastus acidophilus]PPQ36064.1 LysR family transcriptional regulator [Rhodoblastus acidophilus]RAI18789.1 LysR family transcriptional regulator [Rhodoblastus acidophilus]SNB82151.1 transcriptional regulator, LysR family [Rhodoblastus acidophilus]